MEGIIVKTAAEEYPILFSEDFSGLGKAFLDGGLQNRKAVILSDSNVLPLYGAAVADALRPYVESVFSASFSAGEQSKHIETILGFYDFFLKSHVDRKTVVIGLGGGVAGDMAGFAAATYLRGIPFVQIPTTLLAQVDSSVGGKVGIDYKKNKNIVGAFYQPQFVYMNLSCLDTLPEREFRAGLAEAVKCALLSGDGFYEWIQENKERIRDKEKDYVRELIRKCCLLKASVVSQDEKESGLREILNFGHTIGHAVESLMDFRFLHGECVAIGMRAALQIGVLRKELPQALLSDVEALLKYFGLPLFAEGVEPEAVYDQLFLDKKVKENQVGFVLLRGIGQYYRTSAVSKEEILSAISYIA